MSYGHIKHIEPVYAGDHSAGLIMRIIFCAIKLMHKEDEAARYKKRIKNSVVMLIIAQLIFPIKEILISYFGNGY